MNLIIVAIIIFTLIIISYYIYDSHDRFLDRFMNRSIRVKKINKKDYFGIDEKPFEPDNTLLHRNPWDDIDYIKPVYKI